MTGPKSEPELRPATEAELRQKWTEQPEESFEIEDPNDPGMDLDDADELLGIAVRNRTQRVRLAVPGTTIKRARAKSSAFILMETPYENQMRRAFRGWVNGERELVLGNFDKISRDLSLRAWSKAPPPSYLGIIGDLVASQKRLSKKARPVYQNSSVAAFEFTVDELGGIPVFTVDSPELLRVVTNREKLLTGSAPSTLRKNLLRTITEGVTEGESVQEIRSRVAHVFDVSASSAKALQIARTEVGGVMNLTRDAMFDGQGIETTLWSNAGDEVVRESHREFGNSGAHDRGFNYLELIDAPDASGILAFPSDPRCQDLGELLNCRCIEVPA